MNNELLTILDSLEREKGISREVLFSALEAALVSAARKILGKETEKEDITVTIDRETGEIKVISEGKEIRSDDFGRISAQTAKQVIIQKIREAERDVIFEEYLKKKGGITSGLVHRFEKGNIVVDLGKTEAVMPRNEQIPKERYKQGDRVRAYILDVVKMAHGPQIVLSRKAPEFVKKLFELEVPEILEGIVEIRAIARECGERTKMAVYSKDEKVDPVGSCVGMRGARVKDIVKELHGERIDIIRYDDALEKYLANALSPVEIKKLIIDRANKRIQMIVKDDQLSIGIGKHGQNIRLASMLIGWELDIRGEAELAQAKEAKAAELMKAEEGEAPAVSDDGTAEAGQEAPAISDIKGVGKKAEKVLRDAGFDTAEKIAAATADALSALDGIGTKTAEKIIASARELLGKGE
ncbi:MAG: transcription termination factor NusA [Candidatus Omnitrophica bacterium]|nr:transcription termination factor NusA [Candidatus Omnitrophota bacterium]